jgi:hypothetical protein
MKRNPQETIRTNFELFSTLYSSDSDLLYLKDWHLVREYPTDIIYKLPTLFSDDWINFYWDQRKSTTVNDDYRFVYMGPSGRLKKVIFWLMLFMNKTILI